ncbi:TPA: hypothetical protein RGI57_001913, partial [Legionella pneumophila]|nr:hypothetical protein [Legionella pneumophila]
SFMDKGKKQDLTLYVHLRKYKQLSAARDAQQYELVALNEDWADIRVDSSDVAAQIIGCGVSLIRGLKN